MLLENHKNIALSRAFLNKVDVAEIYSPPRVVPVAKKAGLIGGSSLDLTTCSHEDR